MQLLIIVIRNTPCIWTLLNTQRPHSYSHANGHAVDGLAGLHQVVVISCLYTCVSVLYVQSENTEVLQDAFKC